MKVLAHSQTALLSAIGWLIASTAHAYPEDGYHNYFMHGEWGMIGPFMMLIPLAILILIVWLIVKLVSSKKNVGETDQAMSILRERFARGEIDQQEFESRKQHLDHSDP